jgi:RimJ/RimL family protein N-acetyltransferase
VNLSVSVASSVLKRCRLRSISDRDQEYLRDWKNANRHSFFHTSLISPEQQLTWFRGYLERSDDYMFMVTDGEVRVGCMGIRIVDGAWDIYNVILGDARFKGRGLMSDGLQLLCSYALKQQPVPIGIKVLKANPALGWYLRNGFGVVGDHAEHVCLAPAPPGLAVIPVEVTHA